MLTHTSPTLDRLLKTFSTNILHTYNLLIHALAKEYQHPPGFKDVYLYIPRKQWPTSVPVQKKIKSDLLNCIVITELLYRVDTHEQLIDMIAYILLVIPEKIEPDIFHMYHFSLLSSNHGVVKHFPPERRITTHLIYLQNMYICQNTHICQWMKIISL